MTTVAFSATAGPRRSRFGVALACSILAHAAFLLLIYFDVAGIGSGFGLGMGPGFGMGSGGGFGLGKKHRRQVFSLEDLPDLMRPDDAEERLAQLLKPEQRRAITIPESPRPRTRTSAVVKFARPVKPIGASADLSRRFAAAGAGIGGLGLGGGGGSGWSLGFSKYVGTLRKGGLDVVLVVDATGSMQNVIDELKRRLGSIVATIQRLVPTARVGIVAFRDQSDDNVATAPRKSEDFKVRWADLTFSGKKVQGWLNGLVAEGGGDWEEAVKEGLQTAMKSLKWRKDAKKVIIVVGSSPPHEEDKGAIRSLVAEWASAGGVISTIDVSKRLHEEHERRLSRWLYGEEPKEISPLPEFYAQVRESYRDIAKRGGGKSIELGQDQALTRHLLVLAFGAKWEKEVARIGRGM